MEAHHTGHTSHHDNRRASPRMRTLKHATIILAGGYSTFECIIRNISATGAMLEMAAPPIGVPGQFNLSTRTQHPFHPCTVRWRAERALGVSFDDVALATH